MFRAYLYVCFSFFNSYIAILVSSFILLCFFLFIGYMDFMSALNQIGLDWIETLVLMSTMAWTVHACLKAHSGVIG